MKSFVPSSKEYDSFLIGLIFTLAFIGISVMFTASFYAAERDMGDPYFSLKKQFLWLLIGITVFIIVSNIDFQIWEGMGLYLSLVSIVFLILVFVPGLGKSVGTYYGRNFNRWIGFGPFQIQPSEFAKIGVLVYLSSLFYKFHPDERMDWKKFVLPVLILFAILLLIVLEPSFGTTLEILFLIITMIFLSGFSLTRLILAGFSLLPLLYLLVDTVGYRRKRIDIWLNPYQYRYEEGHQLVSSYQAFQSGSWFGNQVGSGYSHRYLPYSHTDFVLSTFVEDYGWLGLSIFLLIVLSFLLRAFLLVKRVKEPFGFFLGAGCIVLLSVQFLMNLYVVTGLIPVTGVSLPFFSYGGSSLVATFILCGILVNITKKENLLE